MKHLCPACGADLISEQIGMPLHCRRCNWQLITRAAWQKLPPFRQGFMLYMQGSWPTSELAAVSNPYEKETDAWRKFREGEQRAMLAAQDSEE